MVVRAFLLRSKGKFYLELLTSIQGKLIHVSIQGRLSLETSAVQMRHYGEFITFVDANADMVYTNHKKLRLPLFHNGNRILMTAICQLSLNIHTTSYI